MTIESDGGGFWERLDTLLKARGWDAGDLSFHLAQEGTKVSPDTIRSWQDVTHSPRFETVYAIADLLRVDARNLFGVNKAKPTMEEIQRLREAAAAEERGDIPAENG